MDATDLTAEEIVERVMASVGIDLPLERRAGWDDALAESAVRDGLVVITNAQRAGRTRRSAQPRRVVRLLASDLAVGARTRVLVEREQDDERLAHDRLIVTLAPASAEEGGADEVPPGDVGSAGNVALRALALAEVRRTPVAVWEELARALSTYEGEPAPTESLWEDSSQLLTIADDGTVAFRDERVAEAMRRTVPSAALKAVNSRIVEWLRNWAAPRRDPQGWASADPVGRYAAHGLAMHAVQAGVFDEVQRDGRLVAHLDRTALVDAADCHDPYWIDGDSPAADATNLWLSGVDSLPQSEWASWLHLTSTVRGDREIAAGIERSGVILPWRVRWAHWRPPGGMGSSYLQPGPLTQLSVAPEGDWPGRTAVIARGSWDARFRVWDAETGEALAGPWRDEVPTAGQREPLWHPDEDSGVTPDWDDLLEHVEEPAFLTGSLKAGNVVVVAGSGGVFAVEPAAPGAFEGPRTVHGEPMFKDAGYLCALSKKPHSGGGLLWPELFEPQIVRRCAAESLPDGLADTETRRVLTETGLPAFEGAAMALLPLDEQHALAQLGTSDEDDVLAWDPPGLYYRIGMWRGQDVALHGPSGQVHLLPEDPSEEDEGNILIAGSLCTSIELLQTYLLGRCMLAMAAGRVELEAIREDLEIALSSIDEPGTDSGVWSIDLEEQY
ncbi:SUKH-4 family immunity protein [Streptomyces inhibens]|uniref:SUKH-4 family immunity protein n=1 Tax=Streptomyces inhibens TaxID=2293571 RepID=UPI001EE71854|nr:SUKH-4 family immunity protein [Streptomyces inhibens]UKY50132.1 SUKH-4 family immunity protein [Streptomyces inhibens]